jgi:hypothetical protein
MNNTMKAFRRMFAIPYKLIKEETGIPADTWASYETGRRRLSEEATRRLSEATGIAAKCFHSKSLSRGNLLNIQGRPYTEKDFALCKKNREPEGGWNNSSNRRTTYATLLVSWYLLDAINEQTLSSGIGLGRFQDDLKRFVNKEISRVPRVQAQLARITLNRRRLLKWFQEWRIEFEELFEM